MGTLVSVIMPIYNGEKYISDAVQSVVAQTLKEWELIIVDDCSTDKTIDICVAYQKAYGRIKVLTAERHGGVSAARNIGIREASGKYMVFLDADDTLTEDSLEVRVKKMEEHRLAMGVFNHFMLVDEKPSQRRELIGLGRYEGIHFLERIALFQTGINLGFDVVWDKIFRTNIIQDKKISFREDMQVKEDSIFVLEYVDVCGGEIEVEDVSVVTYHRRSCNRGSLMKQFRSGKFRQMYSAIKEYYLVLFKVLDRRGSFIDVVRDGFYHDYINKIIGLLYDDRCAGGVLEEVELLFEDTFFLAGIETYQCKNEREDPVIIEILREKSADRLLGYLEERL